MSKYTTEVRYICETYAGLVESADYLSIDEVIENIRAFNNGKKRNAVTAKKIVKK